MDPWGADTNRSNNAAFQPKKFTSYERDANGSDEAMFRRSNRWHSRFDQPDPYDGSYDFGNPQSFNRYAYTQGDPVNFVDPSGLDTCHVDLATGGTVCIPDINGGTVIIHGPSELLGAVTGGGGVNWSLRLRKTEFELRGGMQQHRGYQPLKRGEAGDNGLADCLRAQFAAARQAGKKYAAENALSLKPSASTVVVATAVFVSAMVFTKQPVLSGLAAGAVAVAKDVVGENVVRITKRIASSVSNEADLNVKLGNCYRERGQEPPGEFLPDSLRVVYGNP